MDQSLSYSISEEIQYIKYNDKIDTKLDLANKKFLSWAKKPRLETWERYTNLQNFPFWWASNRYVSSNRYITTDDYLWQYAQNR